MVVLLLWLSSFYILDISLLSDMWFANIFSYFVGSFFSFFFRYAGTFKLDVVTLIYFCFLACAFGTILKIIIVKTNAKGFFPFVLICCVSFSFDSRYIYIFPFISSLSHCLLKSVLFNFPIVVYFPDFFLLLVSSFIPSWLENLLGMISTLRFLRLVTYLYDLSWWMFCMTLKRM